MAGQRGTSGVFQWAQTEMPHGKGTNWILLNAVTMAWREGTLPTSEFFEKE